MARAGGVLGKGLSALMEESYSEIEEQLEQPVVAIAANTTADTLPLSSLNPGRFQPRNKFSEEQLRELADSIVKNGVMQPIIVRPVADSGNYEIIAGERRWRASKLAGLDEVPVIIRDISDQVALEFALVENIQRQDLSPLEEAQGYQQLIQEFNYTQEELSKTIGKSRSHIANLMRLLSLPQAIKDLLEQEALTMGHARALLGAQNPTTLAEQIIRKKLNVRQAEALVRKEGQPEETATSKKPTKSVDTGTTGKDPDILALEETLSQSLGLPVRIENSGKTGELIVSYDSLEQLDQVLRRLSGNI